MQEIKTYQMAMERWPFFVYRLLLYKKLNIMEKLHKIVKFGLVVTIVNTFFFTGHVYPLSMHLRVPIDTADTYKRIKEILASTGPVDKEALRIEITRLTKEYGLNGDLFLFYLELKQDHAGRYISDIWKFNHSELEDIHDYVQLLFPDINLGMFFPLFAMGSKREIVVPQIVKGDTTLLHESSEISRRFKANMLKSLDLILDFYGFQYSLKDDRIIIEPSPAFKERAANWLTVENHNFLRITRILGSLRWCGLEKYSLALFNALGGVYKIKEYKSIIDQSDSFKYWKSAVNPIKSQKGLTVEEFTSTHLGTFSEKTPLSDTLNTALYRTAEKMFFPRESLKSL